MTLKTLILRSLRFHARAHLGVVLGAAVGSTALIGALVVGDSVRGSLEDLALQRLGRIQYALAPNDRFFRSSLSGNFSSGANSPNTAGATGTLAATALRLPATASAQNGTARANHVQLIGVSSEIQKLGGDPQLAKLAPDAVALNEALAAQLKAAKGDTLLFRVRKPSALAQEAILSPRSDSSIALRLRVQEIVPATGLGNFSLTADQVPPLNAFVPLESLAKQAGIPGRANLLLVGPLSAAISTEPATALARLTSTLEETATLADFDLELRDLPEEGSLELRTSRVFLDAPVVRAAHSPGDSSLANDPHPDALPGTNHTDVLTYLVNQIQSGGHAVPYLMATATDGGLIPAGMGDDEILINQWLADDLQIGPGADVSLEYFLADAGARLVERTNHFRVRAVVPMTMPYADRALMPDFPGIAKAESTHDWDAGFPLVHKIRDQDDSYWKRWRGTPKVFVNLAMGKKMWANRFGDLTAIRFTIPANTGAGEFRRRLEANLRRHLNPAELGLRFESVRSEALAAANQAQDFGQLFLGFSFFLILAALILIGLLCQFGLEQRATEIGTLLALGYTPGQVRRIFLGEGTVLALLGGLVGLFGGLAYARAMLLGLTTIWRDAVGTSHLNFHATLFSLAIGFFASALVSAATLWLVLRRQARQPARELLAEGGERDAINEKRESEAYSAEAARGRPRLPWPRSLWIGLAATAFGLGMAGWALWRKETDDAETFFSAGSLLLIAAVSFTATLFTRLNRLAGQRRLTLPSLGLRGCTRRRKRSLAAVGLLACGSFLILSIGAFKLDASANGWKRSSGTGGFALLGQSTLPVIQDLNTQAGREFFGLNPKDLEGVDILPFRVRNGDDASCLNLNRARTPRVLGVNPRLLQGRNAFTFAKLAPGSSAQEPWLNLQTNANDGATPAIADVNSIVWAMGKKVGDTLTLVAENGQPFNVRLIGGLANSILQGSLIISEPEFLKRFPGESGYRMFLADAPSNQVTAVSAALTRALQDVGLELMPAPQRLAAFNAVQNTYLKTFQVLGGLGLLLGTVGLGVVVLRNVLERRGELALLQAVGFRRSSLRWLVLAEHGALLGLGLAAGMVAAVLAILPVLLAPGADIHAWSLLGTLTAMVANGLLWTSLATGLALRGELLKALRNE